MNKVFVLHFIRLRNPTGLQQPFFTAYVEGATWEDQLKPAIGSRQFTHDGSIGP